MTRVGVCRRGRGGGVEKATSGMTVLLTMAGLWASEVGWMPKPAMNSTALYNESKDDSAGQLLGEEVKEEEKNKKNKKRKKKSRVQGGVEAK